MKTKLLFISLLLLFVFGLSGIQDASVAKRSHTVQALFDGDRTPPPYYFSILPTQIRFTGYDYFPAGYNSHVLNVLPQSMGGGYAGAYHALQTPTSQRRVFKFRTNASGALISDNQVGTSSVNQGFPTLLYDYTTDNYFIAWHETGNSGSALDVKLFSGYFYDGIPGPWDGIQMVIDNPITINNINNNQFILPQICIGPSPITGKQRLYVMGKNNTSHTLGPCSNVYIAYADFSDYDIEMGTPLAFSYTHIAQMNLWNIDSTTHRQPQVAMIAGDNGKLYVIGYHTHTGADGIEITEPEMDVFINDNYGSGNWRGVNWDSAIPITAPNGPQYTFRLRNTSSFNVVKDNLGRLHLPGIWACRDNGGYYHPYHDFVKEMVFDTSFELFQLRDIYPRSQNGSAHFNPWEGSSTTYYNPYPHWDHNLFGLDMKTKLNHQKMTNANSDGMMACVWQDTQIPTASTPQINISISGNNGNQWSDPIILSPLSVPELASQNPMYVYPANKITLAGYHNSYAIGKLGLFYLDDFSWGPQSIAPEAQTYDGGNLMLAEITIQFPNFGTGEHVLNLSIRDESGNPIPNADVYLGASNYVADTNGNLSIGELCMGSWDLMISKSGYQDYETQINFDDAQGLNLEITLQNELSTGEQNPQAQRGIAAIYPNPFNPHTTISYFMPQRGRLKLAIYNIKGQKLATLFDGIASAGEHKLSYDGKSDKGQSLPSGIYFLRYHSDTYQQSEKLILMK